MDISDLILFGGIGFGVYYFVYGEGSKVEAFTDTDKFPVKSDLQGGKRQERNNDDGSRTIVQMEPSGAFQVQKFPKPDSDGKITNGDIKILYYDKDGMSMTIEQWTESLKANPPYDTPKTMVDGNSLKIVANNITPYNPTFQPLATVYRPAQTGGGFVGRAINVPDGIESSPQPFSQVPPLPYVPASPLWPGSVGFPGMNGFPLNNYQTIPNSVRGF